ncbi:ParB/RepB/Spo0J family partition protein [Glaciimonas sp. GG7]
MSIKDRLRNKTEGLVIPNKVVGDSSTSASPLRTGPGQMLMVSSLMKESNQKVALLEQRVKEFDGTLPVRLIDADKIVASKWANRINESFLTADFLVLKDEIASSDGNVQPIKVRPLAERPDHYEIVFGHRRHRACLDLGLPVLALVEDINDLDLFKEMDRENRNRSDLSPWEQGRTYQKALNEKLFSSLGELSKELGIDKGNASKALRLAELPDYVVQAFSSPLELQFRWAKLLDDAVTTSSEVVLERAKRLSEDTDKGKHSSKEILGILIGAKTKFSSQKSVVVGGKSLATIHVNGDRISVEFSKGLLSEGRTAELYKLLEEFLKY